MGRRRLGISRDPRLDPDQLVAAASLYAEEVAEFRDGRVLFGLRE